ncbi:MAG: hypothetical protein A3E82_07520 [Gammaproteobacteria bacterium RIFCSPHIGHO2_12_FULL_38_11]|nr:MAG: hypothetical protein A3E82_07520 [Gammaproteobacteria bacterium RIFCSPHIGHO2_12_FULL_38_11]
MKSLELQLSVYQQQHSHKINNILNYIGVPAVIFSLLMVFNWISIDLATKFQISFSVIFVVGVLIYYFLLHKKLAIAAAIVAIPLTIIAAWVAKPFPNSFSGSIFLILFIGGWILQLIGTYFEKLKPISLLSTTQLLIGPLFVLIKLLAVLKLTRFVM